MPDILASLYAALPEAGAMPSADDLGATQDIERAHVPIYIFDLESHAILAANAAAQRLYGYTAEEFRNKPLYDIRPPDEVERTRVFLAKGWPTGLRYSGVWRHQAKGGRVFSVSAMGLKVERDGRKAVLAIVTDLTQTMHAPRSAPVASALFPFAEEMDEACWVRSLDDGRLAYLSPAFERIFGLLRREAYADPAAILGLIHHQDIEAVVNYRQAQARGPARVEYRILRPDGGLRWIASRSFPLVDAAGARMAAGFAEDITGRKQAEQRRLEAIEAQRDALVREVHHRIKNSLQGTTVLLRQFAVAHPELAPLLAEAITRLQSVAAAHGLQGRSASGRVELRALLQGIVAAAASIPQARIEADIPAHCDPCLAIADKDAVPLALALNEIVVNAVKHGTPGCAVGVVAVVDAAAGTAEVRVANSGRLSDGAGQAAATGSGLQLIRMLLPPQGACFRLHGADGEVIAVLRLGAPVVMPLARGFAASVGPIG